MCAYLGMYHAELYYSNLRPHKCQTRNYASTLAEIGPAMAVPAGPVPVPMITACDYISQTFPVPLYLHTRNNQILEVTKACEQRLSSVHYV